MHFPLIPLQRPTLLAKIFGCFKISFRKTQKDRNSRSKPTQMNLLVMENLFYDRTDARKFDLKGSMRNRKVQSTGEQNEVLLDENMVEFIYESPLFAREHSKKTLRQSVSLHFSPLNYISTPDVHSEPPSPLLPLISIRTND